MKSLDKKIKNKLVFICFGILISSVGVVMAETDKEIQEKALKAREQQHGMVDHSGHMKLEDTAGKFRGVFYGYLPCHEQDCNGIKMTLSLNAKNNYLLVIQPAKAQNRESFEKGKYEWDEKEGVAVLTPNKGASERRLAIKGDSTLLYLTNDGAHMSGDRDRYLLQRTDQANNREMHIH
jgi:hypothetical protein